MSLYRNRTQRDIVVDTVEALLRLSATHSTWFSKETLALICDRYCYLVDPPAKPGEINYREET